MTNTPLKISDYEFDVLKDIMYKRTGVFLRETKKALVISRLRKRLLELGLSTFAEYISLLRAPGSPEGDIFVNAITTNETNFYRHPKQFDYLSAHVLPELRDVKTKIGQKTIRIWSAACSTGEEPYTIAMICQEFFMSDKSWDVRIYASDINSEVLNYAKKGEYSERSVRELPEHLLEKYFQHKEFETTYGKEKKYLLSDNIMKLVQFQRHNLLTSFRQKYIDVVFFRNVMIYFGTESKEDVLRKIHAIMSPGGYLFISLSENLPYKGMGFEFLTLGVHRRLDDKA